MVGWEEGEWGVMAARSQSVPSRIGVAAVSVNTRQIKN